MLPLPHYFGQPTPRLFGHLHLPEPGSQGQSSGPAVLLCPTFGQDAMSSHRSLRLLAEQLARSGCPCLRFDPPGTGDSAEDLGQGLAGGFSGGLPSWPVAIGQAIDHLKTVLGVSEVVVMGLRLGALMAALACEGRSDVTALVAWAAPVKGRAFVRECKALGMATLARTGLTSTQEEGSVESGGYRLTAEDIAWLQAVDLISQASRPAPRVLSLDLQDMPAPLQWHQALHAKGCVVESWSADGHAEMMQVPHFSVVPAALFARLVPWIAGHAASTDPTIRPLWRDAEALRTSLPTQLALDGVVDHVGWLPAAHPGASALSHVLTTPPGGSVAGRPAVLMINTGGEHRVGTNRMYTPWSRRWASKGWTALRLDLSGLGESPNRPGCPEHDIHLRHATEDILTAVAHLQHAHGASEVHLIGLCSGAFHALTAAFEGVPLRSVTAINQMVYFWQSKMPLAGEASDAVVVAITQGVGRSLKDPSRWLKLVKGEVNVSLILRALGRRLRQQWAFALRQGARWLRLPVANDLHTALLRAADRGVFAHLVFSQGEPGLTLVHEQARGAVSHLRANGRMALSVLPHTDHTFTQQEAQQRLFEVIDQGLSKAMASGARMPVGESSARILRPSSSSS